MFAQCIQVNEKPGWILNRFGQGIGNRNFLWLFGKEIMQIWSSTIEPVKNGSKYASKKSEWRGDDPENSS